MEMDQNWIYLENTVKKGFRNVSFTGTYNNTEKERLLANTHILNNCYGYSKNTGKKLKYAVSNRFYDGIVFHIPQLVESNGYKTEWAKSSGVGVSFPPDTKFADKLYQYYQAIDCLEFDDRCRNELNKIMESDDRYIKSIDEFIQK